MPAVLNKRMTTSVIAFAAVALLGTSAATADTTETPNVTFSVAAGANDAGLSFNAGDYGSSWSNPNGTFGFNGANSGGNWDMGWSLIVNPDPFVIANLVVTNNSDVAEMFTITVNMPINAIMPSSLIGGSITGTVTDLNGDGAMLSSVGGTSIYQGLIDGGTVATLLDDPFSVSVNDAFGSEVVGPASFGDPIPSMPGPGVTDSIGITLTFMLSAGDSASFTSIFVAEVPGPAGLALFGVAGFVTRRGRRRA